MSNTDKDFKENDLSVLKIMMLLFFTVAASVKQDDEGLLKVFNNFVAMPIGHIESDVWDIIKCQKRMEMQGIDPHTSHMLSERSTI